MWEINNFKRSPQLIGASVEPSHFITPFLKLAKTILTQFLAYNEGLPWLVYCYRNSFHAFNDGLGVF